MGHFEGPCSGMNRNVPIDSYVRILGPQGVAQLGGMALLECI